MSSNSLKNNKIKVFAIVGPTASGKTDYSINFAKEINGEIISADSRLVYKGMDIGTAKPSKEEMQNIPHHMIDIVEPEFEYSAALYQKEARQKIYEINQRGKTPIIVGGTGLYIDILLKNFNLPNIEPNKKLREELATYSVEKLTEILKKLDINALNQIEANDRKKLIRAIEIIKSTGKPLDQSRSKGENEFDIKWIGRNFERDILYERINKRVDIMLEQGLVEETKNLINKHGRIPNIINTIGYKEIDGWLQGLYTYDEAVKLLKQNTRHYAKRQMTWFRRNPEIEWNIYPHTKKK